MPLLNIFLSLVVPVAIYCAVPAAVRFIWGIKESNKRYLVFACIVYAISWYLPSPLIEGKDTSFTTHVIGGGVFSGLVWLYIKDAIHFKAHWILELISLYFFVSTLGVTNELFEFVITKLHIMPINPSDTWWDFLANTLGALGFWVVYSFFIRDDTFIQE